MAAIDLTTLAALEAFIPLESGNSDEAALSALITAVSQDIANACGRIFQVGSYTETRNGTGADMVVLKQKPIVSVTSVTIGTVAVPAATGGVAPGFLYDTAGDESASRVYLRGYRFERGIQNVAIVYSAGYAAIPADLAELCIELVTLIYRDKAHFDLASKGMAGETTSFLRDMKPRNRATLERYKRKAPAYP